MTAIHNVGPRATDTDAESTESMQHFYFFAVAAIVLGLVILRIIALRRRNQALSDFFRVGRGSQYSYGSYPPHESNHGSMYHGIQLAPPPTAYRPDRRIRATDVDAYGRRLGPAGEGSGGKDALPAYDNFDRPPKYIEAGWSHGGPPPPTEQAGATPSPEGEQSRMTHLNTTNRVPGDHVNQPFDDTRAMTGIAHRNEALQPPPAHHDLSGS